MKHLFSILIFSIFSFLLYGQGIPPNALEGSPHKNGILVGKNQFIYDSDTSYIYEHSSVDSLIMPDSIYISGDSIRLRDGAGVAQLPTASTSTKGLLSSTDWNTFNGKGGGSGTVTSITTTSPLTGGTITGSGTIGISNAAADGTTIGVASFAAADFNSSSGNITIDYTNGQEANGSTKGFLTSAKWTDFNNKVGGSGANLRLTYWNGSGNVTSSANLFWDGARINLVGHRFGDIGGVFPYASTNDFGFAAKNNLHFYTNNIASGYPSFTILANGKVGFNNAAPTDQFHVRGAGSLYTAIETTNYGSVASPIEVGLKFYGGGGTYLSKIVALERQSNTGTGAIRFINNANTAMTIDGTTVQINSLAGTGSRMVVANSSGDLSTSAIPTAPETFAAVGSKIQSWNSTGTFGSGKDVGFGVDPTREIDVNGDARLRGAIYDSANSAGSSGQVLTSQGSGAWTWTTPNTGTVTSVGINTGGGVTSVSGSPVTGSGNISLTLADQSASNELQTISTSGTAGNITLSNGGGTLNLNVNDADANATNELQNLTLTGQTLDISQGAGVTLPIIDVVQGSGITVNKLNGIATISASSAGSTEYIDPYIISSDTVGFILKNVMDTVQFIGVAGVTGESTTVSDSPTINMTLTGTNITGEIVDGSVTPAKLSQAYLTSEVDGSTTNEIQTLSISGSDLTISGAGGNTVTLPSGGGSSEWASLHYGSLAANTQTLTSSVWNTINFTGSSESNASIIDANHTNDEIEFVVAGTYQINYKVSFIANADALIYSGIYSSVSSSVDGNTQMESDTDSGYKHTIMQHSYIKTVVAGEKIKLQVQPLIAHTSVAIYSNFIVTKL